MAPLSLPKSLEEYIRKVKDLSAASDPGAFWEQQLAPVRQSDTFDRLQQLGAEGLQSFLHQMPYGFTALAPEVEDPADDAGFRQALALADKLGQTSRRYSPKGAGVGKDQWEHAMALLFLQQRGLLADYTSMLEELRVSSSMSTARHFFYGRLVERLVRDHLSSPRAHVLEIGAGAGGLAVCLMRAGLVESYTIIDLPEMILLSGYTVATYLPDTPLVFSPPGNPLRGGFSLITPQERALLPDRAFDLVLNFNSFMEMDRTTRDSYFETVYRTGRSNSLFINVNRRQREVPQRGGPPFDNNPLLYLYRADDRVLVWEEEEFQQVTRSRLGKIPSLAVLRVAMINPEVEA